jgi:hypothetical protein
MSHYGVLEESESMEVIVTRRIPAALDAFLKTCAHEGFWILIQLRWEWKLH